MNELILRDTGDYKKYEELLLKRDQLYKEACSIQCSYLKEFGALLLEDYELKVECIRIKKKIAYCQAAIAHGNLLDVEAMERTVAAAMAAYETEIKRMISDKAAADKASVSPSYKVERAKRIYRRLAKILHPDLCAAVTENEELRALWERIVIAYHANDDVELENLEVLVRLKMKELGDLTDGAFTVIGNIEERIAAIEAEINDIVTTEPYVYIGLMSSEARIAEKKAELQKEIDEYKKYCAELSEVLRQMIDEGGGDLTWVQV
ncbi:hypothetical protein SAMN02910456_02580 [Ruminococcaceae bacterium YRB3002]|nr:hypothetical protein SAMN02910456_02580 [Ruminococcaceae bacterium YRB3002]